jgi:hypothetical protein
LSIRTTAVGRRLTRLLGAVIALVALAAGPALLAGSAEASVPSLVQATKASISGPPVVGSVLKANPGTWNGAAPFFYTYYWTTPNSLSHLADTPTYTPAKSDLGQVLTVHITVQDNNNAHEIVTASTPPITKSDIVSTVHPKLKGGFAVGDTLTLDRGTFTSGSGPLTYTYTWSQSDGTKSSPLANTGTTYRIGKADLGLYIAVTVTARSATEVGSAKTRTAGAAVPAAPFPTDAGLTSANQGHLTGKVADEVVTITDSAGAPGDHVFVYSYSTPIQLGWLDLGPGGKFTVNIANLSPGLHKLAVLDSDGGLSGWVQVNRNGPSLSTTANGSIALIAAAVLVLAIAAIVVTAVLRRRRRVASES